MPIPAYLLPNVETDRRKKADKRDKALQKPLGARTTPASGSRPMPSQKGDLQNDELMFETKGVQGKNITIGPDVVGKLCRESATVGKSPVLVLTVEAMPEPLPKTWVCMPLEVYEAIRLLTS